MGDHMMLIPSRKLAHLASPSRRSVVSGAADWPRGRWAWGRGRAHERTAVADAPVPAEEVEVPRQEVEGLALALGIVAKVVFHVGHQLAVDACTMIGRSAGLSRVLPQAAAPQCRFSRAGGHGNPMPPSCAALAGSQGSAEQEANGRGATAGGQGRLGEQRSAVPAAAATHRRARMRWGLAPGPP